MPREGTYELRSQGKKKKVRNLRQTSTSHNPTKTLSKNLPWSLKQEISIRDQGTKISTFFKKITPGKGPSELRCQEKTNTSHNHKNSLQKSDLVP